MADQRLIRLLKVLTLIRARVGRNVADLATELEVHERTIYRDLAAISCAGIPCHFDREDKRYRIVGDFFLPPMQFSLSEALSLSVLADNLTKEGQVPFLSDAWRAVTKIRSQLPPQLLAEVNTSERRIKVHPARVSLQDGCNKHFETLRKAIADGRKVRCEYVRASRPKAEPDDKGPFLLQPYSLYFGQRAWYVIGLSEKRGDVRTLKLNRLKSVKPTDLSYGIPDGWTVEKCFGKAWRMIPSGRIHLVKICFDAEHAPNVAETLWHPSQRIDRQLDGSLLFHCEVDGLDEILWWVLGYGSHAEVLAPQELRNAIQEVARDLSTRYGGSSGAGGSAEATIECRQSSRRLLGSRQTAEVGNVDRNGRRLVGTDHVRQ